jgi:hypothetical protein
MELGVLVLLPLNFGALSSRKKERMAAGKLVLVSEVHV